VTPADSIAALKQMPMTILIQAAALLPLMWGWAVYRLMEKLWPENEPRTGNGGEIDLSKGPPPLDYQI
jgi:hypothetical protein